jgi:FAD binding domain/Berberine and berberine like
VASRINNCEQLAASLKDRFRGELVLRDAPGYEEARGIWNGMVARRPGLIAKCACVEDVQSAVRGAAEAGILTAIRCGGHSLAGFSSCDDGMVIDLSRMRAVKVDEKARRARFEGGCLLANVDRETQREGLAFPAGVVSHTGASGLVLGGGTGWLTRMYGLSCDNVEGFTAVIADGSVVKANAKENAELYWALRGGGGNFGVVTQFEVKLHPLRSVLIGRGFWSGDKILPAMRRWRDMVAEAPENLRWDMSLRIAPAVDSVPANLHGKAVASSVAIWIGDQEKGRRHIERIFGAGGAGAEGVGCEVISYLALQTMADLNFPHGRRYYTKSGYFNALNDDSIEKLVGSLERIPAGRTQVEIAYLGGAAARVGAGETAFGDRSAPFIMNLLGDWADAQDDAAHISFIRGLFNSLRPAMKPGVYVNFMSGDESDRTTEAYSERWQRLVEVKTQYDPKNFFRLNQNIPPGPAR